MSFMPVSYFTLLAELNTFKNYHLPLKSKLIVNRHNNLWKCINISSRSLLTRMKFHYQDMKTSSWFGVLTHTQCIGLDIHCSRRQMVIPSAWIEVLNSVLFEWLSFSEVKSFLPLCILISHSNKFLEVFTKKWTLYIKCLDNKNSYFFF